MNNYEKAIDLCVRTGMAERLSCEDLTLPLIKQLGFVAMTYASSTGAKLDDVIEILHMKLDELVVEKEGPRYGTKHPR